MQFTLLIHKITNKLTKYQIHLSFFREKRFATSVLFCIFVGAKQI